MNITVVNGSPKGKHSVTLQTVRYLMQRFPDDTFTVLHAGAEIRKLEKDMAPALHALADADVILFAYPVYTFLAPSQLHRFIELLKASGAELAGKAATQLTTSKRFFDVTAHRYLADNCHDMGLSVIPGLSADMDDLLTPAGRREAVAFWELVRFRIRNALFEPAPVRRPAAVPPYAGGVPETPKTQAYDVVVVADLRPDDAELAAMVQDFAAACAFPERVVNIREYPLAGGCLGCFRCAVSGSCVYTDGFDVFLREQIQSADAIVYAFAVADHSMGARFKMYDDRQFCNGHRTVTSGKPTGYLVRGDYAAEENLRTVVEGRAAVGGNPLMGVAVDSGGVRALAASLLFALQTPGLPAKTFYGVGGMKIFRDLIYEMQGLMRADHRFYKQHGVYDFPQKRRGKILKIRLLGALIALPGVQKKLGNRMTEGMLAPYRKVLGE